MKYDCDTIRDLMPLCADGIASEASSRTLEAHLAECETCAAEWESLRSGGTVFPETEVPEETKQYAKTAKRVRKKHLLVLICTVLAVALAYFGNTAFFLIQYGGGRLSAENAALRYMDSAALDGGLYPSGYAFRRYNDLSYIRDYPREAVYTAANGATEKYCFVRYTNTDTGKEYLDVLDTKKIWGLWFGAGTFGGIELTREQGVYTLVKPIETAVDVTFCFYVSDPKVAKIELAFEDYTEEHLLSPDDNGICAYKYSYRYDRNRISEITARALDTGGNVLYTMENGVWTRA